MTRPDNTRYLRVAAQARHDEALRRTREALRVLARRGQPITFSGVAATARVSRTWLYRQPALRAEILKHRSSRPSAVPASQRPSPESMHARIDALRLEIQHLRAENAVLRDHVARALGEQRAQPQPLQPLHVHNAEPLTAPRIPQTRSR